MSKLNIIQRRELEPLVLKAAKIVKYYEKAANCRAYVMGPDMDCAANDINSICASPAGCAKCSETQCAQMHIEAVNKARVCGGSYIYLCKKGLVFWTSPFYSGERFAGALFSGGIKKSEDKEGKVKALAQLMLLCADQISGKSFVQKNVVILSDNKNYETENETDNNEKKKNKKIHNEAQIKGNLRFEDAQAAEVLKKNLRFDVTGAKEGASLRTKGSEAEVSVPAEVPLELERMLFANLRRGDIAEGQKILVKLLKTLSQEVINNFKASHRIAAFRLKAIELAVLLTRAVSDPKDIKDNTATETFERCLKKIEESSGVEEITNILLSITERMSGKIFSFHGIRHFSALRKAERYIWTNYTRKLSLKEIARASGLSAPYLSTVFKEEMGENLSNYLNRLRIEKAAAMLITTNMPISEIAKTCGFEDQSWFSKIFKNNTNLTPGKYRERGMSTGI